jgi:predicted nucleotidyltransferase
MSFGLRDSDIEEIRNALRRFPEIKRAVIFGSRAKGVQRPGSDVDIAIFGESISFDTLAHLHYILEEDSTMPYFFDIVAYHSIDNLELKAHIDLVGIPIYTVDQ